MQGVIKSYDPGTGDGIILCDTDLADYDLARGALVGSPFRMLRQGQRVIFDLDDAGAVDPGQPEPAQTADFAGTWEMHNSRGTPFILTLRVRGARVSGKFVTPGRPKNSGVLEGRITADGVMDYVFEQPRLRFRGQGRMTVSGDRIEGQFSVENSAEDYSWSGVRTAGEAQ